MKRNDALWKGVIEDLFDDFLSFFFPQSDFMFSLNEGVEFLDKELHELFPGTTGKNIRFVDKLVKVHTRDGPDHWILVHVEVQGQQDKDFEERMFTYFYRIFDKHRKPIAAIAIFSDSSPNYHPKSFEWGILGTELRYSFTTFKVLDQKEEELKASPNPFSIIILTVLLALKKGKIQEGELFELKLDLAKQLLSKSISKPKIHALMNFLRFYVRFEDYTKDDKFELALDQLTEKTQPMGIEEIIKEQLAAEYKKQGFKLGRAEGRAVGIEEGRQEGREEGREEGKEIGRIESTIQVVLSAHEQGIDKGVIAQLVNIPVEAVDKILAEYRK
ncbi:MAG: Rpn family recombination-promoting nuclease/putative transposase [Lewinella sp.]|nr:Rpn family recombination-promoting nuclease/putative transposase [Lewinella sp.]